MNYYLCKDEASVYTDEELKMFKFEEWKTEEQKQGNKNPTFKDFLNACKRYDTLTEINPLDCSVENFETEEVITDLVKAIAKYRTSRIRFLTSSKSKNRTIYFFVV